MITITMIIFASMIIVILDDYNREVDYDINDDENLTVSLIDKWISGFFDKNSFIETLDGWAKTVVCGRARYNISDLSPCPPPPLSRKNS